MKLSVIGCNHQTTGVEFRERLAFTAEQAADAVTRFRGLFPATEAVLLSTCNRVELYTATGTEAAGPDRDALVQFLAEYHHLSRTDVADELTERTDEEAVRHLFTVAASLDSMVVGEPQIVAQIKQAYELAQQASGTGPLTHAAFQRALYVAKRVQTETDLTRGRVSIPSVAVSDFARRVFDTFSSKVVVVLGAGEMAQETVTYLRAAGATDIRLCGRSLDRTTALAGTFGGVAVPWEELPDALTAADILVTATGATEPVVTKALWKSVEPARGGRTLFALDLAVPRDIDPRLKQSPGVYLFDIEDLKQACDENRRTREREWPRAERIIAEETDKFLQELYHRATGPTIQRLQSQAASIRDEELRRLLSRLPDLDEDARREVERTLHRLVNKILHPPLQSLREEAAKGVPHGLLGALRRLFYLDD